MSSTPQPDRAALEIAFQRLAIRGMNFEQAMNDPTWQRVIKLRAKKHMAQRARMDIKRLQAGDID